jgi:hypothetical protein
MKRILIWLLCAFIYLVLLYRAPISDDLGNKIRKLEWVKIGGCGYVAYYISDYLDSNQVKYQIVQIGFGKYKHIHYMVKVNNVYMDKNGTFSRLYPLLFLPHRTVTKEYLRSVINDPIVWNKKFNRSDTIRINQILNN